MEQLAWLPDNTTVEALQKVGLTSIQASEQSALYTTSLGFFGYSSGVFGGIIVGCLVAWITGRFYKTKLPTALAFFAGSRTVPIVSLVAGGVLAASCTSSSPSSVDAFRVLRRS